MTSQLIDGPTADRVSVKQDRFGPSRHTISRKALLILAASAMLGVAAIAPNAALAFLPPPPPGPPPGLAGPPPGLAGPPPGLGGLPHPGLGGPPHLGPEGPAGLSRLAGPPGFRGSNHGGPANIAGRSAAAGYGGPAVNSYGRSGSYRYHHNELRNRYYGVYVGDNYDSSYAYSDDGCYYTYRRGRRVMVCSGD
jgi:hypothetical protein